MAAKKTMAWATLAAAFNIKRKLFPAFVPRTRKDGRAVAWHRARPAPRPPLVEHIVVGRATPPNELIDRAFLGHRHAPQYFDASYIVLSRPYDDMCILRQEMYRHRTRRRVASVAYADAQARLGRVANRTGHA